MSRQSTTVVKAKPSARVSSERQEIHSFGRKLNVRRFSRPREKVLQAVSFQGAGYGERRLHIETCDSTGTTRAMPMQAALYFCMDLLTSTITAINSVPRLTAPSCHSRRIRCLTTGSRRKDFLIRHNIKSQRPIKKPQNKKLQNRTKHFRPLNP